MIGGLVGLVLGNLRLPLTLLFTGSAAAGAGTNIAVSAIAATSASVGHARARRIDWHLARWMLPPSIIAGFTGGWLAGRIDESLLLAIIAVVLLSSVREVLRPPSAIGRPSGGRRTARAVAVAALVGLVGGIVGLILGALRLPALIRIVGQKTTQAIGTNQVVGAALGYAGLAGHLTGSGVDPALVVAGAAGAAPGGVLGARLTGRLSEIWLRRAIAAALVISAGAIIGRLIVESW